MRTTSRIAVLSTAVTAGLVGLSGPAATQELPDTWHPHPPGALWLVAIAEAAEGQGTVVACPDATDKLLLNSAVRNESPVVVAGVCMTDSHVYHLRRITGGSAPAGWSAVAGFTDLYYKLTPRG